MKQLFVIAFICSTYSLTACAQKLQEAEVPGAAKAAFQKQYPNTKASWEKEKENYEVNFKKDGKVMSSVIDKTGATLETETDIKVSALPSSVQTYVKDHYKGAKIKEAAEIVRGNGEKNYEAEVGGKDVLFDANGKFLKETND